MKLRLTGTEAERAAAVVALAAGFELREVSEFYPNRGGSLLGRVYVDAGPIDAEPGPGPARPPVPSGRLDVGPFGADERAQREALAARLATIEPTLVVRTARNACTCTCSAGPNYLPSCTGAEIAPGEVHVEYLGEAPAYASGTRYHAACAIQAWIRPRAGGVSAASDRLDAFTAVRSDRAGGPS